MDKTRIQEIIDILSKLKTGASNNTFPIYAQYLNSNNGQVTTCNGDTYICLNYELPFTNCVNLNVLYNILRSLTNTDIEVEIFNEDNKIVVYSTNYKTQLTQITPESMKFPNLSFDSMMMVGENAIQLDEDILNSIKYSLLFTGTEIYSYSLLHSNGICATNKAKVFLYREPLNLSTNYKIKIDKKIASFLTPDSIIGVSEEGNVYVQRPDGYCIFVVDTRDYPLDSILKFTDKKESEADNKIVNSAIFSDCIGKLMPIFHNESMTYVTLTNKNNNLSISATTAINGTTKLFYDSLSDIETSILMDISNFKNILFDYDLYLKKEEATEAVLKNENSLILILG